MINHRVWPLVAERRAVDVPPLLAQRLTLATMWTGLRRLDAEASPVAVWALLNDGTGPVTATSPTGGPRPRARVSL